MMWLKMSTNSSSASIEYDILPEDSLADIADFTSLGDACRMAVVSKVFRSAAESNLVWKKFLPTDYRHIIAQSDEGDSLILQYPSMKKLYFRLADHPLLIDGSTKSFWLEKLSGKKCYMISARSISIIWSDTPRCWRWTSVAESRFPEVVELLEVLWLEIRGKLNSSLLSPKTNYSAYLIFKLTDESHGFNGDVKVSVAVTGKETKTRNVFFLPKDSPRRVSSRRNKLFNWARMLEDTNGPNDEGGDRYSKRRNDGWLEMKIGSFFNENGKEEVEFSVLEIKRLNHKKGLILEGIEVRPHEK